MYKAGEIIIIETMIGTVVIGEVTKVYSDASIQLKKPRSIILDEKMLFMVPYTPFSRQEELVFARESIITSYYPITAIEEKYLTDDDTPPVLN